MVRVKRGNIAQKRHNKIIKIAKGYQGTHSKLFRVAKQQVIKALKYNYISRKTKKRFFRKIWISRLNAALKTKKSKYNYFINFLKKFKIYLNRKILSQLAILDTISFYGIEINLSETSKDKNFVS